MKKILVSLMAAMLVLSLSVPVFAVETGEEHRYRNDDSVHTQTTPGKYLNDAKGEDGIGDGLMKFDKYLITNQGSSEPEMKFDFFIEPGAAMTYDVNGKKFEVLAPLVGDRTSTTDKISTANISKMPEFKVGTNQSPAVVTANQKYKTTVTFSDTSTAKNDTVQAGDVIDLDAREQYQKEEIVLDFTNVYFYEPGVYRFKLTEAPSNVTGYTEPSGIYYDTQEVKTHNTGATPKVLPDPSEPDNEGSKERILDVYVVDKNDDSGDLRVEAYILHERGKTDPIPQPTLGNETGTNTQDHGTDDSEIEQKSKGFVNEYKTVDLDIKKEVKGNQASRDKYFEITLQVDNAVEDVDYIVSIADDGNDDTYDGSCDPTSGANAATIPANEGRNNYTSRTGMGTASDPYVYRVSGDTLKKGEAKFYLQHGQHIVVRGLPETSSYKVTENAEDYKSIKAEDFTAADNVDGYWNATDPKTDGRFNPLKTTLKQRDKITDAANGTTEADANINGIVRTSFLNKRSGIIPTGIIMSVAGGFAIVLIAIAFLLMLNRRRREYDYE